MANQTEHLTVRITPHQKHALEAMSRKLEVSVGQLIRRAIANLVESSSPATVSTFGPAPAVDRETELDWLAAHRAGFPPGTWVALDGDRLLACGTDPVSVVREARALGVAIPFVERIGESNRSDRLVGL